MSIAITNIIAIIAILIITAIIVTTMGLSSFFLLSLCVMSSAIPPKDHCRSSERTAQEPNEGPALVLHGTHVEVLRFTSRSRRELGRVTLINWTSLRLQGVGFLRLFRQDNQDPTSNEDCKHLQTSSFDLVRLVPTTQGAARNSRSPATF